MAESLDWDESLVLGIRQIDEHHQHLFGLLKKSYETVVVNDPRSELGMIIDELSKYTAYHFSFEERLMHEYKFPRMAPHLLQHSDFSSKVVELKEMYDAGDTSVAAEVVAFLRGWLVNHILKVDSDYAVFLKEKGVS